MRTRLPEVSRPAPAVPLQRFVKDERAVETVEYAIITALVVAGTLVALAAIGVWVLDTFSGVQADLAA